MDRYAAYRYHKILALNEMKIRTIATISYTLQLPARLII
jgi:hypothetical protein